jgi:SAM-dependent MidA family methyltransferase
VGGEAWVTVRDAWRTSLYGEGGFYRTERPIDHFSTSAHVGGAFADAVLTMARERRVDCIVDVGSGCGELLTALSARAPDLRLVGLDVRPKPAELPVEVEWRHCRLTAVGAVDTVDAVSDVTAAVTGATMLFANELLDNVPCDLVELADDGPRQVEVDPATGRQRLGAPAQADVEGWLDRWWPLERPGQQAPVGLARERLWSDLCAAAGDGLCVAVDYGHRRADRPTSESPTSYRRGGHVPAVFDRRHDITSFVAVDALAASVDGAPRRQSDVIASRLPAPTAPPADLARVDPRGYLRRLSAAGDRRELTARPGLGDFWWIVSGQRAPCPVESSTGMPVLSEVGR